LNSLVNVLDRRIQIMKYFVTVWLAVVAFNCLIDATPLPEDRAKTPKEVQKINKWLGVDKNSDILKDILEVAVAFTKIEENKQIIEDNVNSITDNADDIDTLGTEVGSNAGDISDNAGDISDNAFNISSNAYAIANNNGAIATNADAIEDNANDIETLTVEVDDNADNIWYNTGDILDNAGDISKNADHIEAIKAVISIYHGGSTGSTKNPETTTKFIGTISDTFGKTTHDPTTTGGESTTDPTTTEPTTTVQTTTDEPTTTVVTSTQQTTTGGSDCTIDGFEPDNNGNCFKVVYTKLNWAKAIKACKAHGSAILATVPNAVANIFIKGKLSGNSWIGGTDLTKEGTWKWINGDTWSFVNWKNSNDIKNKDEDCAYMASSNGKWQDEACTKKMQYVCMEK